MKSKEEFNATGRRIVVEIVKNPGATASGIIVDENKKPDTGVIVAIGHEVEDPAVEVGKVAVFSEYAGKAYKEDSRNFILLDIGELYITKDA